MVVWFVPAHHSFPHHLFLPADALSMHEMQLHFLK